MVEEERSSEREEIEQPDDDGMTAVLELLSRHARRPPTTLHWKSWKVEMFVGGTTETI
jgi:hypothetical protein